MTILIVVALLSLGQSPAPPPAALEALDGIDPVLLVGGKEVMGKAELKVVRGRFEYWFASPETRAQFETQPENYEIQLGGLCARMGGTVRGNPSDFIVHDGRIYIFGSDACHKTFVAAPAKYLKPAMAPMPADADVARRGREALDRAVRAIGGAAALDGLTTLSERESHTESRRMGDVTVTTRVHRRFPDAIRAERDMPMPQGTMTVATLLLPRGGWSLAQDRVMPMFDAAADNARVDLGRHPVALLRRRNAPGFAAAALGRATVAGVDVDQVRVKTGRIDVTLGLDSATGFICTLAFVDRGPAGYYGQYVVVFDEYRGVNGLKVPFARRALFDGTPDPSRSTVFSSIEVNATLDPRLFEPTAAGK